MCISCYLYRMEPLPAKPCTYWAFDTLGDNTYDALLSETSKTSDRTPEKRLCCKICGQAITHERDRIEICGAHAHTFYNPHGLKFYIGCFQDVSGCVEIGVSTLEFTWFPGYAWRIALCGSCHEHLGWEYHSDNGGRFHGLILTKLSKPS